MGLNPPAEQAPSGRSRSATRSDVAKLAGTSTAVVSYVMNDGPRAVAPSTRKRVLDAVAALEYRPNRIARSLSSHKTSTIALIVPDNTNPFFSEMAKSIEAASYEAQLSLVLGVTSTLRSRELHYVTTFADSRVDGMILIGSGLHDETIATLIKTGIPYVLMDREFEDSEPLSFTVDNEYGGYLATKHLIGHGYTDIACLAGPDDVRPAGDRIKGYFRAMEEAGLPTREPLRTTFEPESALAATLDALDHAPARAIFACADVQALSVIRAAAIRGLSVPDDIAVIGFDGTTMADYSIPSLSTVRQPYEQLAAAAISALDPQAPTTTFELPLELILRESCGCSR